MASPIPIIPQKEARPVRTELTHPLGRGKALIAPRTIAISAALRRFNPQAARYADVVFNKSPVLLWPGLTHYEIE